MFSWDSDSDVLSPAMFSPGSGGVKKWLGNILEYMFVVNRDLKVIERSGYTLLDLLSDIGGVQGILQSFFGMLVGILNYGYLDDSMVSKLYKYKPPVKKS